MLEPLPSRSVARYLLPMTDIMAVLFSLFLLLPHLQSPEPRSTAATTGLWTPEEETQAREELQRLRRLGRMPAHERLLLVVLDIDGNTGDLLFSEGGKSQRLRDQTEADAMIQQHLAAARAGQKELYYILRAV